LVEPPYKIQGADPNLGEPGFLSYHRQVRFFLMMEDINRMKRNWQGHEAFSKFTTKVELVKQDVKEKEEQVGGEYDADMTKFFKLVATDVDKTIFDDPC
jgi:hypothetical protein